MRCSREMASGALAPPRQLTCASPVVAALRGWRLDTGQDVGEPDPGFGVPSGQLGISGVSGACGVRGWAN